MSLTEQTPRVDVTISTATDAIPFGYAFSANSELLVVSSGRGTLNETTDYTVSGAGVATGGTVTMVTGVATEKVTVLRNTPISQTLVLRVNGKFFVTDIGSSLDKITKILQEVDEELARCLKSSVSDGSTLDLPDAAARIGKLLRFDDTGALTVTTELGDWEGEWETATAYNKFDMFRVSATASVYVVVTSHTSSNIASDFSSGKISYIIDGSTVATAAAAAATSETNAATSATAAATSATNAVAQVALAAAQVVLTNADVVLTASQALIAEGYKNEAEAATPSGIADTVDASIGLRRSNQKNAIYTNGAQAALITENKARVDLDTLGFCIVLPHLELPDWTPTTVVTLLDKSDSNLGVKLTLETNGSLKLAMGNGTNFTTLTYASTALITNNDAQTVQITINCERADSVYFYVNGSQLGAGVGCTDSTSQNLTNSGNWEILTDGAGWVSGYFGVHLGVRDVADIYADYFRPERLQLAKFNQTALISDTKTFGIVLGSSNWSRLGQYAAGTTFNNDGVSDGSESRDNCYKYMPSSSAGQKRFYRGSDGVSYAGNQGQIFRIRYGYYIPTAAPNVTAITLLLNQFGLAGSSWGGESSSSSVKGAWTDVELVGTMGATTTGQPYWYLNYATSFSGDEVDDMVYFSNWTIDVLGWGIVVDVSAGEWCKPDLSETGTSKEKALPFNTYVPSGTESTTLNNEFWQSFTLEWAASSAAQNMRAATTELFSAADQIEIWAKSTSGEHFIIGDEADSDRYFAEAVIGTSWVKLSLANTATDGTNLELIAQPLDGSASPESRTDALQLRIKTTRLELRK